MKIFCFGYGYVAQAFKPLVIQAGGQICGTQRVIADHADVYAWHGQADLSRIASQALQDATGLLISVPPGENGCPVHRQIDTLLPRHKHLRWVGYVSTSSVYGDRQGEWVDEEADLYPTSPRAQQRITAEQQWQNWGQQHHIPVQIFRLSGIYGPSDGTPQRSPFDRIAAGDGKIIEVPGHVFNRIHVDDIAQTLLAGYRHGEAGAYNVSDDLPASQADVMRFAYELLGQTPRRAVKLEDAELSPMAKEFWRDCKRVCNEKIKRELNVTLHYPTYVEGLSAIYKARDTQPSA